MALAGRALRPVRGIVRVPARARHAQRLLQHPLQLHPEWVRGAPGGRAARRGARAALAPAPRPRAAARLTRSQHPHAPTSALARCSNNKPQAYETETALATMLVTNALSCTRHYYWSKWYDAFKRAHGPLPVPYAGSVPIWDTAHDEKVLATRKKLVR